MKTLIKNQVDKLTSVKVPEYVLDQIEADLQPELEKLIKKKITIATLGEATLRAFQRSAKEEPAEQSAPNPKAPAKKS